METRPSYLIVGSFVLVIAVGLIGFIAWVVKADIDADYDYYQTYFTGSVSGLSELSEVRYRGVPVGRVVDVGIDLSNVERVEVLLELEPGTPIKEDSVTSVEMQGITGLSYILITGGHHESPTLVATAGEDYPVMGSKESRLQEIFSGAPDLINRTILLIDSATRLMSDDNINALSATLSNVKEISSGLRGTTGKLDVFIDDVALTAADLRGTAKQLNGLATELRGEVKLLSGEAGETMKTARNMLGTVDEQAAALGGDARLAIGDARQLMAELAVTARALSATGEAVNEMIAENREPIADFTQDGLYEFSSMIDEIRILVTSLTRIAEQLEADPSGYLLGGSQQGFEAE